MTDATIFPRFYVDAVENTSKTQQEGRPIFEDKEFVEILIAGDSKTKVVKRVTDEIRNRWPGEYEAFKKGQEGPVEGTPLDQWPLMTPARIHEMKALNIFTVEALAELSDANLEKLGMGGRDLQKQAKAYLRAATKTAEATRLAKELAQRDDEIEMLKGQLAELSAVIDELKNKAA